MYVENERALAAELNLLTKQFIHPARLVWKAPLVVGKLPESVTPVV